MFSDEEVNGITPAGVSAAGRAVHERLVPATDVKKNLNKLTNAKSK